MYHLGMAAINYKRVPGEYGYNPPPLAAATVKLQRGLMGLGWYVAPVTSEY